PIETRALRGLSLEIPSGQFVAVIGSNGAGKSTTLKAIAGVVPPRGGRVLFRGNDIAGLPPHRIAAQGLCFVPEHRGIFKLLTVEENLKLGAR
ncbi:ATP-binding cassette domain-containing protein, partial [Acinetobacter baumannii]|nr:ATP-binding cassette domain-containing protein [Acinetobacter baumannii]